MAWVISGISASGERDPARPGAVGRGRQRRAFEGDGVFALGGIQIAGFVAQAQGFAQVVRVFSRVFAAARGVLQHQNQLLVAIGSQIRAERGQARDRC